MAKFDIPVPCFFGGMDFNEALLKIKALGFDCVETYNWKELDIEKVRNTLDENGMRLLSICTSEFRLTDPAYSNQYLDGLRESVDAADRLGANMLITQVGNDTGDELLVQREAIVTTLLEAAPLLEDHGKTLLVEPLNTLYDHKGYFLSSSAEAFDIIREIDSPNVKIVFDIYHQQVTEGNIINNIRDNLPLIAHMHCAGHPGRHELQYGENDYRVIFKALDEMGYDGHVGLEYGPLLAPEESLRQFRRDYIKE